MAWIEYHTELRDHWKIHRLSEALETDYNHALGTISLIWLWAAQYAPKGDLSRFSDVEIRRAGRFESEKLSKKTLKECSLIDDKERLHDWKKHGLKYLVSTRNRMRKYRERLRNGNVTVTPTVPYRTVPNHTNKKLSDESFLEALKTNPAYSHIDVMTEFSKMDAWLLANPGRQKTRRFIVRWLNKVPKPLGPSASKRITLKECWMCDPAKKIPESEWQAHYDKHMAERKKQEARR